MTYLTEEVTAQGGVLGERHRKVTTPPTPTRPFSHYPEYLNGAASRTLSVWEKHRPAELSLHHTPELIEAAHRSLGKKVFVVTDLDDVVVDCSTRYHVEFNRILHTMLKLIPEPVSAESFNSRGGSINGFCKNENLSPEAQAVASRLNPRWQNSKEFHKRLPLLEPQLPQHHIQLAANGTPVVLGLTARPPSVTEVTKQQLFETYQIPEIPVLFQPSEVPGSETASWKLGQLLALLQMTSAHIIMIDDSISTMRLIEQFRAAAINGEHGPELADFARRLHGLLMMSRITNIPEHELGLYTRVTNWQHIVQYTSAIDHVQQSIQHVQQAERQAELALESGATTDEAAQFFFYTTRTR